jgi:hypothetical protein
MIEGGYLPMSHAARSNLRPRSRIGPKPVALARFTWRRNQQPMVPSVNYAALSLRLHTEADETARGETQKGFKNM